MQKPISFKEKTQTDLEPDLYYLRLIRFQMNYI